ncbi:hypothetical protein BDF22DRAFT_653926 [Syncephalis plumigaleata]|nr:hypothetical protein BDF22DRAFT_653926 [Syncephalis plumigaleata]
MRPLLHYTTLAVAAALTLALRATQTQALGGRLTGDDNPKSYARNYMNEAAAKEGLSNLKWYGGGTNQFSFATVTYNDQYGFMKCIPTNSEKQAFDALVTARDTLAGINVEYRNYVAYPLTSVSIPKMPSQPAGNCYVYRYIKGVLLSDFISKKNYAQQLIILNQIMPQLLKGFIYLYNAGIKHADLHTDNAMILTQGAGQLSAVLIDFDVVGILPPLRRRIDISTVPIAGDQMTIDAFICQLLPECYLAINLYD